MANGADPMMADLEDGELSGSNSDPEMVPAAAQVRSRPPQTRQGAPTCPTAYRNAGGTLVSSDSDGDSSGDDGALWRRKRQKVSNAALQRPPPPPPGVFPRPGSNNFSQGRKVNNVWGPVIQEQCQDAVAAELVVFGMEGEVDTSSRSVETYNHVLARKMMEKEREMERQTKDEGGEASMLDAQLEDYMRNHGAEDKSGGDAKRKRPVKERLGPRSEMDAKGRYEITEDDPADKVAEEIAYRLQEPKKDLVVRIVNVLGTRAAIELLGETATLEENGGVRTVDGSRRRTPGGVYIYLLKNTPSVTKAQIKQIFLDEQRQECKNKKAAQKRRRHLVARKMKQAIGTLNLQEHDDVSRETFASDTNEALESLEERAGEEEEEDQGEEVVAAAPPVGTEDTAVIYNPADLEVF